MCYAQHKKRQGLSVQAKEQSLGFEDSISEIYK